MEQYKAKLEELYKEAETKDIKGKDKDWPGWAQIESLEAILIRYEYATKIG